MSATRVRRPPRVRRPDERPQEILDAALTVFAERGYHETRLEEVAEAAGVTKGAIYHYFDTKADLLLQAIEHHQAKGFDQIEAVLKTTVGPATVRIRTFLRKAFGGDDPARRAVLMMLAVARDVPELHARWLAHGPLRGWQLLAGLIDEGKASGEFRRDVDSDIAARVILSGILLQVIWQRHASAVPAIAVDQDRLIDSTTDLLLAGLRVLTSM